MHEKNNTHVQISAGTHVEALCQSNLSRADHYRSTAGGIDHPPVVITRYAVACNLFLCQVRASCITSETNQSRVQVQNCGTMRLTNKWYLPMAGVDILTTYTYLTPFSHLHRFTCQLTIALYRYRKWQVLISTAANTDRNTAAVLIIYTYYKQRHTSIKVHVGRSDGRPLLDVPGTSHVYM